MSFENDMREARNGNAVAARRVGLRHYFGQDGAEKSWKEAKIWFEMAAAGDDAFAMLLRGLRKTSLLKNMAVGSFTA